MDLLEFFEFLEKKVLSFSEMNASDQEEEITGLTVKIHFSIELLSKYASLQQLDIALEIEAYETSLKEIRRETELLTKYRCLWQLNNSIESVLIENNLYDLGTKFVLPKDVKRENRTDPNNYFFNNTNPKFKIYSFGMHAVGCEYREISLQAIRNDACGYMVSVMTDRWNAGGWSGKVPSCFIKDVYLNKEEFLFYTAYRYNVGPKDVIETLLKPFQPSAQE